MQPSTTTRSPLLPLLGSLALILILGAAFAPVLYWLGKGLLDALHDSGFSTYEQQKHSWLWSEIGRAEFPRYYNRAVLVAAVIVLPLYFRRAGVSRELLPRLKPTSMDGWHLLLGFVLAAGMLLELGYLLVRREVYTLRPDAPWLGVGGPLFAAGSVAVLEEFIFRGILFGLFLRAISTKATVFWITLIFTVLHFLKPPEGLMAPDAPVQAGTGFWLTAQILGHFTQLNFLFAEFFTLFAVGLALAQARVVTGQIWLSVGLHAGWVFGLKYFSALTKGSKPLRLGDYLPWLGENLRTGLVSCLVVAFTGWMAVAAVQTMSRRRGAGTVEEELS